MSDKIKEIGTITAAISLVMLAITAIAAYLTHIVWIVTTFSAPAGITFGQLVLSLFGVFIPPIGALHGVIIWLSALF